MIDNLKNRTYTVAELYKEAANVVKDEMKTMKQGELTATEQAKVEQLSKLISNMVLKEMRLA